MRVLALLLVACSAPTRAPSEPIAATPAPTTAVHVDAPLANQAVPAPAASDRDKDLVPDATDRCPDQAEDWDAFADTDGCPDLDDDGDGIADADDMCPDAKPSPRVAPSSDFTRPGCPTEICKTWRIDALSDCFLTALSEPGMVDVDKGLRELVKEVASFPEIEEVELRAYRMKDEPKEAALARAEPIRARLIALGWPARIKLDVRANLTGDPDSKFLINGDVTKQRFEYDKNFRPGICTMLGDVYRPERPDTHCRVRSW